MRPRSRHIKEPQAVIEWLRQKATRQENGCLICHLSTSHRNAYPKTTVNGERQPRKVHRLIFSVVHGPIPDELSVLHSCGNARCIEIDHLRLGTQKENMQDASKHGQRDNQWTSWPDWYVRTMR